MKKLLATTALLATLATPAFANDTNDLRQQIELLKQQLNVMEQKLDVQEQQIQAQNQKITDTQAVAQTTAQTMATITPSAGTDPSAVKVSIAPLKIESADGANSIEAFGRIQVDAAAFSDDVADHPDGAKFRRARLGVKGKVAQDWGYKMEWDFANDAVNAKDVYGSYEGFNNASIKIGHLKPRLGMEELTSANHLTHIERASAGSAFGTGEKLGVNVDSHWDHGSFAVGVFNDDAGVNSTDDEALSVEGRLTVVAINNDDTVLHLGTAASLRKPNSATDTFTFRSRADNNIQTLQSVSAAVNNVDRALINTVELAATHGPFALQGEYFRADVARDSGSVDADFDGWYAAGSYFLTGENRGYSVKDGKFGRVKPNSPLSPSEGNWGALELTARYSELDLNDSGAGIAGGAMETTTFGLNWYPTSHVKFMANYIMAETDANAVTPNDDPEIFLLRGQVDF